MQKLKMILILCLWSCTASSQSDSLICFTQSQVKTFLITKTELNNCLEQYNAISTRFNVLSEQNANLVIDITKTEKKAVRRGKIAIGVIILSILEAIGLAVLIK